MDYLKHFDRNPAICGGVPIIKGTRVPLQVILASLKAGDPVDLILRAYPSVNVDDVQAVIAWAAAASMGDMPTGLEPKIAA